MFSGIMKTRKNRNLLELDVTDERTCHAYCRRNPNCLAYHQSGVCILYVTRSDVEDDDNVNKILM